ncbi:MAG: MFS transporter [Bacteroidales bacterium]|jgi:OFA family oxalate/formate antiporter-like MFS transporter|nr:MFS transporter [Bacteroidales bacterium]
MKSLSNKPFSPSKFPLFYGWVILAAGTIGILMSVPGQTMGVSVFTDNLIRDLGINRNHLSLAYLIGTLGSGLLITKAGKLYDKHGARVMAFFSGVLLGVMLIFLTRVDKLAQLFNNSFNISLSASIFILLAIGFFGIRFFGQGLLTMVSRNMVMKWFVERRGLANAVLGIFSAFGFSLAPKILNIFIEELEWRGAWVLMALIVGIVFAIFVLVFYRDNPKDSGCVADGNSKINAKRKRPPSLPDRDYTLKEARKTMAFWAFTLGLSLTALYISGFTFHVLSVFETSGMSDAKALGIFIPTSLIAVVVQFGVGYASDYVKLKYLLVVFMVGMIMSSCGLVLLGSNNFSYWLVISGNGVVWGLYTVLIGVTWPRFFGLKNLGAISGYSLSWTVIGSALGPYLFSLSKDFSHSYDLIAWVSLFISVGILILAFKADNPNEKVS